MIKILKDYKSFDEVINRKIDDYGEYQVKVNAILKNVRDNGDKALFEYAEKFDGVKLDKLKVSDEEYEIAEKELSGRFKETLKRAKANIEEFHALQLKKDFELKRSNGVILGQRYTPIEKVGLYVPGGTASYPSTVLMNAIPARLAGVKKVFMTTPVKADKKVKSEILYAAELCGVDAVYKTGGAQAIAAMTYGTESIPKADKIVGPGNIFVALAKKAVYGQVGIDMVAGPSEILIIADETAVPAYVAADLLSQAEHDKLASAVLVTTSEKLANEVSVEIEKQIDKLERKEIARVSVDTNGKIIIVKEMDEAIKVSNAIAPEHLELCVKEPFEVFKKITDAGSVFLGNNTPEPLGDYYAGVNHTWPTSGNARFSSPLSVDDFIKKTTYLYYTDNALKAAADDVIDFATSEGLTAHANAVKVRKR